MADHNKKALNFIEEITSNADEIQNRVLAEILSQNTNVEYLQRHGIDGRTDKETFKKLIPVIDYEYIKEDIDRIANGDTSPILCSKPITEFYSRKDNGDTNSLSHSTASYTDNENQELVDLVDVELGQEYEVVATTYTGLYRYRVGDILRVSGFKNKTPQFNFVCRKNVVLSIDVDKTDEDELQKAVKYASQNLLQFDATLTEYTSYADVSNIPGHYVLYWEISLNGQTPIPHSVFEDCCFVVEESLNNVYRRVRVLDKSITPLEIRVVKNGTFDKLMDFALSKGASASQYKTPRCVKDAAMIKLLNSNIVSSYFSPKCPTWIPESKGKN
ncbi:Indole-3-acetic acid-amido synthetase GH3.3 [Quillaja saponaria]|uniref:Indole-3-acetic acid-amido synthetase GH3.3 n=1 Tax=Quillaja saponaria TaxID=32244 RepID=A0AAD7PCT0_QUISA|nr:Indole-3-acetic acid-amido synthetase GH3.3 [Quillaja saponaria]